METICIAIDGHSSSGKSTLAKDLAKELGYVFIDTGAMYRAVALYFIENNIDFNDGTQISNALDNIVIHFEKIEGKNTCFLNGENVEAQIRSMEVSNRVSDVASILEVREKLVALQRKMGETHDIVMDGRDIGSVVFPNAQVKFFVTAEVFTRAKRRHNELIKKGKEVTFEEVLENLQQRDHTDSTRANSPLIQVEDALLIDNTNLTIEEQRQKALDYIETKK